MRLGLNQMKLGLDWYVEDEELLIGLIAIFKTQNTMNSRFQYENIKKNAWEKLSNPQEFSNMKIKEIIVKSINSINIKNIGFEIN